MEIIKNDGLKKFTDPRQSDEWGLTLKSLGWHIHRTSGGIQIAFRKIPLLGSMVKIQRPYQITEKDLEEIEIECIKRKAMFIKIECYYNQDESIFAPRGYEISTFPMCPTKTMFMDLTKSFDELWGALSKSAKYSINRARREGAKIKFFRNPNDEQLKEFYNIQVATGKHKKFYVPPFKQFQERRNNFGTESMLIMVYGNKGILEGAKFLVTAGKNVVYIAGGTSNTGRKSKSGYLLTWESMLYLKRLGYENFDLEGLDDQRFRGFTSGWGGFSHFKEKFNGTIVYMGPPYIKYISPLLRQLARLSPIGL